ncbi:MAG: hypothetical protein A2633_06360 [Candidatus Sungbacteria bacterium RIFCSPHIGHO2_01_FULL_47_32]|uniref:BF1531-like N-terminal domain-containing protein n=1 Tax=Candidatus Sungbacteria bacterium RIFCSPHIGHO2_01_FULL_47_32 TaxID=1802264 RepID=A0A1G2K6T9_9BACT|nr:MAG: hypothetical protein A2633_06360 [Candidatus Sungbacteria bacterium RIFCSPHIGHO2_01_FULL_47_32]
MADLNKDKKFLRDLKENTKTVADHFRVASSLKPRIAEMPSDSKRRLAILSNFTTRGLPECLLVKSFLRTMYIDVYEGAYGQWRQEVMGSDLYDFKPDVIFILLDSFGIEHDLFHSHHAEGKSKISNALGEHFTELKNVIRMLKEKTDAKIVVGNVPIYWKSILGVADAKSDFSLKRAVMKANVEFEEHYVNDQRVFVFDFDGWFGHIGKDKFWYDKFFFLADMKIAPEALPMLADELTSYLIPFFMRSKKCLVLDLDNTLWGGIIGEDGIEKIALAPYGKGQPFYLFQKLILGLYQKGVILAINSKNNEEDVTNVLKNHPHMLLKEHHFASIKSNWHDKVSNLREIAKELNIGIDSLVFIDDDEANRALVEELLPEVTVVDLPKDPSMYFRAILGLREFENTGFTEEDLKRGESYNADRQRRELQSNANMDLESFLKTIELRVSVEELSERTLARAAQLTQKTNQFNLTTRRYREEDIPGMLKRGARMWVAGVADKFGDYGITGFAIVAPREKGWEIDTFLLSCRVLGKKVEEHFLKKILSELKEKSGEGTVTGFFIKSEKNTVAKDFYEKMGFKKRSSHEGTEEWVLNL